MTDHQHLRDAFAEYERRADAYSAVGAGETTTRRPDRRRSERRGPLLLVAASVVLVLAIAGIVVGLARSGDDGPRRALAGDDPSPTTTTDTGVTMPPTSSPSGKASATESPSSTSSGGGIPQTADQMAARFADVLGDSAKFTVTDTSGNYISGVLTVAGSGARGGYNIQAATDKPGDTASCPDPGQMRCRVTTPAGGGSLAVGQESTEDNGTLNLVEYIHPDGSDYLLLVSNLADPKGAGQRFGAAPPLTTDQMVTILQSPTWDAH